ALFSSLEVLEGWQAFQLHLSAFRTSPTVVMQRPNRFKRARAREEARPQAQAAPAAAPSGAPLRDYMADLAQFAHQEPLKERAEKTKPMTARERHVAETVQREEGLSKPLGIENKGFALLMKLGYKGSGGLGKDRSGEVEPITPEIRSHKQGLGSGVGKKKQKLAVREAQSKEALAAAEKRLMAQGQRFRSTQSEQFAVKRLE
ncbi:unnamed protein product, partial [Chrysoparadoxa australica]